MQRFPGRGVQQNLLPPPLQQATELFQTASLQIFGYLFQAGKVLTFDSSCFSLLSMFLFTEKHYPSCTSQEAKDQSVAYVHITSHCYQCSTNWACPDAFGLRKISKEKNTTSLVSCCRQEELGRNIKFYKRKMFIVPIYLHDISGKCCCTVVKCRRSSFW